MAALTILGGFAGFSFAPPDLQGSQMTGRPADVTCSSRYRRQYGIRPTQGPTDDVIAADSVNDLAIGIDVR